MTGILVSPAEPPLLRALGEYSPLVEEWGGDFLIPTKAGWCLVQRKEVSDFVASKRQSDRLSRELDQIAASPAKTAIMLIEGNTHAYGAPGRLESYSRAEFMGDLLTIQHRGIWVQFTASVEESAMFISRLPVWLSRDEHDGLSRATKVRGVTPGQRVLMSLPGCSLGRARAITEYFGKVPLQWSVSEEGMTAVPGIGKKTAQRIMKGIE
jgi:ERCC4-type nuclease